jgi:RNA polymerase sigma-70 factor (ECF subfamily)
VIRSALRKLKKNVFIEEINDNTLNIPDQQSCALTGEYIEKKIMSLPPGYRTVFLLIEVEGYSHKEVAEMLNISEGTSKSQLFYAKRHLRALLKELVY